MVERVKQKIERNRKFKNGIHELTRNLNKSQRQTPLFTNHPITRGYSESPKKPAHAEAQC